MRNLIGCISMLSCLEWDFNAVFREFQSHPISFIENWVLWDSCPTHGSSVSNTDCFGCCIAMYCEISPQDILAGGCFREGRMYCKSTFTFSFHGQMSAWFTVAGPLSHASVIRARAWNTLARKSGLAMMELVSACLLSPSLRGFHVFTVLPLSTSTTTLLPSIFLPSAFLYAAGESGRDWH